MAYVVLSAFICYLAHGSYKMGKTIVLHANAGNRLLVIISTGILFFLVSAIVLSAFSIYAIWDGELPGTLYGLRPWLRPVFSVVQTLVVLFFVVALVIDLAISIKTGIRREILLNIAKMTAGLLLGAYLLTERWEWIAE